MNAKNTRAKGGLSLKNLKPAIFALILALLPLLCAAPVLADDHYRGGGYNNSDPNNNSGGYSGPGSSSGPMTVAQAKGLRDDSWVSLKGHITRQLGGERYEFKDATGTIKLEIDHEVWWGQNVGPNDLVEIVGEVDKEWTIVEIDVKGIKKI